MEKLERQQMMIKITAPGMGRALSLHNHSNFSDGVNSLEEICIQGKAAGLKLLGISDHWCEFPYGDLPSPRWGMRLDRLDEYVETLLALKKRFDDDDFSLKLGLEVDYCAENFDAVKKRLQAYPLDYLIGSVHYSDDLFPVDHSYEDWAALSPEARHKMCKTYYRKLALAAESGFFTFIGHLDLPKKFNAIDEKEYLDDAVAVLDILQKNGGALELNTAGWFKPCAAPYPAPEILRAAIQRRIPVVISADAHHADHLTRNFTEAEKLLQELGI